MKDLLKALRKATKTDTTTKDLNAGVENSENGTVGVTYRQGQRMMETTMFVKSLPDIQPSYTLATLPGNTLVDD